MYTGWSYCSPGSVKIATELATFAKISCGGWRYEQPGENRVRITLNASDASLNVFMYIFPLPQARHTTSL